MILRIKNLKAHTLIGILDRERKNRQEVLIRLEIEYDASKAARADRIQDALDYKILSDQIICLVESSRYFLLEKLVDAVLKFLLAIPQVTRAKVEIAKPQALPLAESVSLEAWGTSSPS